MRDFTRRLCAFVFILAVTAAARPAASQDAAPAPDTPSAPASDGQTYLLQYKFVVDQSEHYDVIHKTTIEVQVKDFSRTNYTETKTQKHFRVVSLQPDGSATLEPVIDRVQMQAREDENPPVVFDSQEGEEKCPLKFRKFLSGVLQPLPRVHVSRSGRWLEPPPGPTTKSDGPDSESEPKLETGHDASRNFLIVLPEQPVAVGSSWHDDITVPVVAAIDSPKLITKVAIRRNYRLASLKDGMATVELKTSILTPIHNAYVDGQLIQRALSGTIVFDIERGRILSRQFASDKRVINPLGPTSSMRAVCNSVERFVETPRVAQGNKSPQPAAAAAPKQ